MMCAVGRMREGSRGSRDQCTGRQLSFLIVKLVVPDFSKALYGRQNEFRRILCHHDENIWLVWSRLAAQQTVSGDRSGTPRTSILRGRNAPTFARSSFAFCSQFLSMRDRQVNRESAGGEADSYFCESDATASVQSQRGSNALCRHDVAEPFQIFSTDPLMMCVTVIAPHSISRTAVSRRRLICSRSRPACAGVRRNSSRSGRHDKNISQCPELMSRHSSDRGCA